MSEEQTYSQFYDGLLMGLKDGSGKVIVPARFEFVAAPDEGMVEISHKGQFGWWNVFGEEVIPLTSAYSEVQQFRRGLCPVRMGEKWGFIDCTGKTAIEPIYSEVQAFFDKWAPVKIGESWGYIDETGTIQIRPQYSRANAFCEDRALVANENDKIGAIDRFGKVVVPCQYNQMIDFDRGYALIGDFKNWGLVDVNGKIWLEPGFTVIGHQGENSFIVREDDGETAREGTFTPGEGIKWNKNMDRINSLRRATTTLTTAFTALVEAEFDAACPCRRPRIRDLLTWDTPIKNRDQEVLWHAIQKHFKETPPKGYPDPYVFECPVCHTQYEEITEQYSINLQVTKIAVAKLGDVSETGSAPLEIRPNLLGFVGHNISAIEGRYIDASAEAVAAYLIG